MSANLYIDTKEPFIVKKKFHFMDIDYSDLKVEEKSLETGDFLNDYFVVERKDLDDFVNSFTQKQKRKTKEDYERLKTQTKRLLEMNQPIKAVLIIGNDYDKLYSNVHIHSINGQVAKLMALGLSVVWLPDTWDWTDLIYRLTRLTRKYTSHPDQERLI